MIAIKVKLEEINKICDWSIDETQTLIDQTKTFLKNQNITSNILYHIYNPETNMFVINSHDLKNISKPF
jgi:hypothetical protein